MTGGAILAATLLGAWALGAVALQLRTSDHLRWRAGGGQDVAPAAVGVRSGWGQWLLGWRRSARIEPGDVGRLAVDLASALRIGHTLVQGLVSAVEDGTASGPLAERIRRVLDLRGVGVPLGRALEELAAAPAPPEAGLLVTLLNMGRRTGQALPGLLDAFGRAMRERDEAVRTVRALTIQARMSGAILCLLPIGFFGFVTLTSAGDVLPVIASASGAAVVIGGLVLQALGAFWIRRIVRVEP